MSQCERFDRISPARDWPQAADLLGGLAGLALSWEPILVSSCSREASAAADRSEAVAFVS